MRNPDLPVFMHRLLCQLVSGIIAYMGALLMAPAVAMANTAAAPAPAGEPVTLIVPAGKGTIVDTIARQLSRQMQQVSGDTFQVQNIADHTGVEGTQRAAGAAPDGRTLLLSWSGSLVLSPNLYDNVHFDPEASFDAIGLIAEVPVILVVNNELPVTSLEGFTAYVHEHPGRVNFGSTGSGRATHLAGQLYMTDTDTNMVHVGYSSPEQALTNLINGQIQSMFQLVPRVLRAIRENRIRPLAVMSRQRVPALPDVPTMNELGYPRLVSTVWFALSAPQGTPPEIIASLNRAMNAALASAQMQSTLDELGALPMGGSPESMDMMLANELRKWEEVMRTADIPFH